MMITNIIISFLLFNDKTLTASKAADGETSDDTAVILSLEEFDISSQQALQNPFAFSDENPNFSNVSSKSSSTTPSSNTNSAVSSDASLPTKRKQPEKSEEVFDSDSLWPPQFHFEFSSGFAPDMEFPSISRAALEFTYDFTEIPNIPESMNAAGAPNAQSSLTALNTLPEPTSASSEQVAFGLPIPGIEHPSVNYADALSSLITSAELFNVPTFLGFNSLSFGCFPSNQPSPVPSSSSSSAGLSSSSSSSGF